MRTSICVVVYVCLALLGVLTIVSFWHAPAYEKGAWIGIGAISNALSAALGAKFGLAMPRTDDAPEGPEPRFG
jgi:hypothetical protein